MAVTKDKFGVPIDGNRLGILQPKLRYRFRVIFTGFGAGGRTDEMTSNIVSVTRPTIGYEEITIDSYNSRAYVQGKHTWEPVNIIIRDDITNQVAALVGQQVQRQLNHFEQTSAISGSDYKFDTLIQVLDGSNAEATEQWELEGCFLINTNYSEHDYSTSDPVTIDLK